MRKFLLAMMAAVIAFSAAAQPEKGQKVTLRLIETTDVHGSFFPYDFIKGKPRQGSLGRVSYYVDSLRKALPDQVILLDNGDILQGQPICYYYNYVDTTSENIAASVLNFMDYDANTFGNHDIETGHKVYDKWSSEVNCPSLGANILDKQTGFPYVVPYTIVERSDVRVAIIGMLTPAIPNWLAPKLWSNLEFVEMKASAKYWIDFLKKYEKPDVIVGLFHSGYDGGIVTHEYRENAAAQVAREVPGFDVIFYGHDHQRHNSFDKVNDGTEVLVLNPANNAMDVADAAISLEFDGKKWKVIDRKGQLVDVRKSKVNPAYHEHFYPEVQKVKAWVEQPLGTITKTIDSHDCFFGNSEFNDLILNMMMSITNAEIAFSAPLSPDAKLEKGTITVGQMFDLYKFENQLYVMGLTGEEIRKHLEMSYDNWVNTMSTSKDHFLKLKDGGNGKLWFTNATYNFDSAAGIDYEVDVTKPDGEKVKILRMSNGEPFDEKKVYKVAVNSYRGNGGGELLTRGAGIPQSQLESRIIYKSDRDLRSYLMDEIKRQGTITPKAGKNWKFVPEKLVKPAAARDSKILFGE